MARPIILSTEAINYQNTIVFKELDLAFQDIMAQGSADYEEHRRQNEERIESIIKNAYKANISVNFGDSYPAMRIFDEYHNSVLVRNEYREFFQAELKFVQRFMGANKNGIKAGVDINTGQLSGLFCELPFTVYLPDSHLCKGSSFANGWRVPDRMRFTPAEMAAMTLHEVGHFFTYCEMFSRTVTTNQVLSNLSRELDDCYSVSKREVVIARCADDLKLADINVTALAATDKTSIIETAIMSEAVEKSRTELGVSIYDHTASEQLADQFAARHGAGRDLLSALVKFEMLFGSSNAGRSTPVFMFMQLWSIIQALAWLAASPITAILSTVLNLTIIMMGGLGDDGDNTYDTPEIRFKRVRAESINRIKNRAISDEEKKQVLNDIKAMDELVAKFNDKREWREYIATTLIPTYRRYRKTKMLQQQLEQLANNPLFVRSAELSLLAKH